MTSYNAYPPHHLQSSHRINQEEALKLLSSFLEATATDASLHPNALLTESGPISATSGSNTGLVLHNLKRVEAGLRGEHLGADLSLAQFGGEGVSELQGVTDGETVGPSTARAVDLEGQGPEADMGQDGWKDKLEFEREQEDTVGEVGDRSQAVAILSGEDEEVPQVKGTATSVDKEARRQRKKERRRKEKQRKHETLTEKKSKKKSKKGKGTLG